MKIANLYQDATYNENKPVINVLFETDFTKEIRITMQKGTVMKEHKTPYPIVVEILEGNIEFGAKQETKHLTKGDLIALDGNIPHDLKASVNSIIRLTLTKYDNAERVKNIINKINHKKMTKITTILELFIDQLQDRYSAAKQQAKAFEKLYNAASSQDLKQILKDDIDANQNHLKNLRTLLEDHKANPEGEYCEGTAGLVKEAIDTLHLFEEGNLLDVAIAISVQHINHHDIAGYNGCVIIAKQMQFGKTLSKVEQMLEDEKNTDKTLNEFLKKAL